MVQANRQFLVRKKREKKVETPAVNYCTCYCRYFYLSFLLRLPLCFLEACRDGVEISPPRGVITDVHVQCPQERYGMTDNPPSFCPASADQDPGVRSCVFFCIVLEAEWLWLLVELVCRKPCIMRHLAFVSHVYICTVPAAHPIMVDRRTHGRDIEFQERS